MKPFVCTRGRACVHTGSARGVMLGTNAAAFWPLPRCPAAGSTGVGGDCCSCGVFLPEPSSPDTSSRGVAAPLSLDSHSSSSSLPTVDAAIVKPALGFPPPRDGSGFVTARRGAALGTCSRDCTRTVLPVRRIFVRVGGCSKGKSWTSEVIRRERRDDVSETTRVVRVRMCCGVMDGKTVTHLNGVAGASCLIDLRQDWVLLGELEVEDDLRGSPGRASRMCANWSRSVSSCRHYLALVFTTEKRGIQFSQQSRFFILITGPAETVSTCSAR